MFFFIAGIQPRTTRMRGRLEWCPACGRYGAEKRRIDHYLTLFFVPLARVKKGLTFLECPRCGTVLPETGPAGPARQSIPHCPHCGRAIGPDFRFCPFCGGKL